MITDTIMNLTKIGGIVLVLFSIFVQACSSLDNGNQPSGKSTLNVNIQRARNGEMPYDAPVQNELSNIPEGELPIHPRDISNSIGLITTTEKRYDEGGKIRIFNQDGSIWYEFTKSTEEASELKEDKDLHPFRKSAEELLLVFDCAGEDSLNYHVIVNEETGLKKFITKGDPIFKFGTWEEYVLSCFAVKFDSETNPLRQEINGQVMSKDIQTNSTFQPKEIRGDWLKVGWQRNDDQKQRIKFGWIRWKQDQTIVLDFFEEA